MNPINSTTSSAIITCLNLSLAFFLSHEIDKLIHDTTSINTHESTQIRVTYFTNHFTNHINAEKSHFTVQVYFLSSGFSLGHLFFVQFIQGICSVTVTCVSVASALIIWLVSQKEATESIIRSKILFLIDNCL